MVVVDKNRFTLSDIQHIESESLQYASLLATSDVATLAAYSISSVTNGWLDLEMMYRHRVCAKVHALYVCML